VNGAELAISSLLIGGPYNGRVPKDSPSRQRIFVCLPRAESRGHPTIANDEPPAHQDRVTLARTAYRRQQRQTMSRR
jgi:hypothetical protein